MEVVPDCSSSQRRRTIICDVLLVADGVEVPAQKVILAASSPYFSAMFSNFKESSQDRIVLQGIDPQALQLLVDYMYSFQVTVTADNVQVLLPAANFLLLTDVRYKCEMFLKSQLDPSNCLGIRDLADIYGCSDLISSSESYIKKHFWEVAECEEFLSLTHQQLSKLISRDDLNVLTEEKVFESVIRWVNHHPESRLAHLAEVMEHVRFPLMPITYLFQQVQLQSIFMANKSCQEYLTEALRYQALSDEHRANNQSPRTRPRCFRPQGIERTPPNCARCRNHNITMKLKGHKRYCLFSRCECIRCRLTCERQRAMAKHTAIRRAEEQDRQFIINELGPRQPAAVM